MDTDCVYKWVKISCMFSQRSLFIVVVDYFIYVWLFVLFKIFVQIYKIISCIFELYLMIKQIRMKYIINFDIVFT
jgi:hypothetical protein